MYSVTPKTPHTQREITGRRKKGKERKITERRGKREREK